MSPDDDPPQPTPPRIRLFYGRRNSQSRLRVINSGSYELEVLDPGRPPPPPYHETPNPAAYDGAPDLEAGNATIPRGDEPAPRQPGAAAAALADAITADRARRPSNTNNTNNPPLTAPAPAAHPSPTPSGEPPTYTFRPASSLPSNTQPNTHQDPRPRRVEPSVI
ncbi:hypothetical protein C8A05DRAFT_33913 [Staphylotrichum tortipilum]|uniref:Uncharacterized protein n=1 Tax=Staphylotrichum tortipilum TaxID=2831512 RepID=A0AAN6MK41_9PEZI|nr:hypothetical protein C8A05DRAFT_33913 [Staphylotrichum longicolle]